MEQLHSFTSICKDYSEPWTQEEKYVLGVVQPDEFTATIIKAIMIALSQGNRKIGHAAVLAKAYPELTHAVNCLLNGNLQDVYRAHKARQAELLESMGY